MIYIGIDPGVSGAVAVLDGKIVFLYDMPTYKISSGKSTKSHVYGHDLADILRPYSGQDAAAVVEDVHAMPGQGVTSMFSFGLSTGIVHGILAALRIPYSRISPVRWKKVMMPDMGKDKDAAVVRAVQLYPDCAPLLMKGKKKYDGRAEALLMAHYARHISSPGLVLVDEEE